MAEYDSIANSYKEYKESLPIINHVEKYTYFNIIGNDLVGKSILDLGCGEGFYTRIFKQKGAARVVGIDLSTKMIELATQEEVKKPLGIEYQVGNALELGEIGQFDLVVATYLLNYMQTQEQLLQVCQNIFTNLKTGGRFVTINTYLEQQPEFYHFCDKYGTTRHISGTSLQAGTPIKITILAQKISFFNYYLSEATYEWAFKRAGFKEVHWHRPQVSPAGIQEFGQAFWQNLLDYPGMIGIECLR